ncbi:hypothetical protein IFR04_013967 [Cadophora malorum]|uniref:N-acetyltransferase domain-containing protein n=1 Tax=Cadophora malorum TaxID=108018 RepID=A0A8H7T625_9HELO|nr:hypothetical protein IFR04_013967 [Cadophora malorum]
MAPFTIHQAVPSDLDEMVDVWVQACKEDTNWRMMKGSMTEEQEYAFVKDTIRSRVEIGVRIGAFQSWKIVDEDNGEIAGWTSASLPKTLTKEETKLITPSRQLPPEGNAAVRDFMLHEVGPLSAKNGFDRTKHFHRQGSMVRPEYQRQGLMRRLTAYIHEIADAQGEPVYVSARSAGAGSFLKQGFEVLEWVDLEMGELDENFRGKGELKNGKTRFRLMKREAGAKPTPEKKLIEG